MDGRAEIELLGFLEQSELVERFAKSGEDGFPRMPLAQDVVACLVAGSAFGEVVSGVAFAFPVGQIGAGEDEMFARSVGAVAAVLAEWAVGSADNGPVAAETVFDGDDRQIDPCGGSR